MMGGTAPMGAQMRLHATPATEPAGPTSLVVSNVGWRTHELVFLPLAAAAVGQRVPGSDGKVSQAGSVGEASSSCASGAGTGLTSGSVGWVTVTLAPGRYELLCNLPNHYADGMRQELTISYTQQTPARTRRAYLASLAIGGGHVRLPGQVRCCLSL